MPALSVVITVVEGGAALARCLDAVSSQHDAGDLEVIVPCDETIADAAAIASRYSAVRIVHMGRVSGPASRNAFAEHGLYERRRAAGLRAARGRLVAMLEDRGAPRPGWAAAMIALHARMSAGAIGGVVEHGGRGALRWALFFSDFGRYQVGVPGGAVEYLSDVNICYKRDALDSVRELWEEIYQESTVNWALRARGYDLQLVQGPVVVEQRGDARLWPVVRERIHWARIFAHVRGRESPSRGRPLLWAAATPVLPSLLFWRHLRRQLRIRRHLAEFVAASPATLLLLHAWALGECIGYVEASTRSRRAPAASRG